MFEIRIELVGSAGPPTFRLFGAGDRVVKLLEIRVTEVGEKEPCWRVVHELMLLDDLVDTGKISRSEADAGRIASLQFRDESMLEETAVPVSSFRYGEAPAGMRELTGRKELEAGRLYTVTVSGNGHGELDFYA